MHKPHRYRLRVLTGPRDSCRHLTLHTNSAAVLLREAETLHKLAPASWRIELRDMREGREGSLLSTEELRRRARRPRYGDFRLQADRLAERRDRHLAASIARWAQRARPDLPGDGKEHDWQRVRDHVMQNLRNAEFAGPALDQAIDRVDALIARLRAAH
jgi:hypothetical protein